MLISPSRGQTTYLSEDFEDGDISGWTEGQSGDWTVSTSTPITGSYSLKHNLSSTAAESYVSHALTSLNLASGTTTWKFNLKNGSWDPSGSNRFWAYLIANETNIGGSTVDGYAVGVNLTGTDDILTLWKVTDGAADGAVVTSSLDWGSSDLIGIEVTRNSSGTWELKFDSDGGFDNQTSAGTGSNTDYTTTSYFGLFYDFTSSRAGKLRMDDITVSQTAASNNTSVQFTSSSASVAESVGTYDITVSITNEDASNATTVELALTGGTASNGSDITTYSTQTLTFPANSSTNQTTTVTISDDSSLEGDGTLIFQLQNVSGGNSAEIGPTSQFTLTIQDNELIINEVHADPDATNGDANGDGTVSTADDEFVELVNNSGAGIDMSDWTVSDGVGVKHTFASGTTLKTGQGMVVFGGGTPTGTFGGSLTTTASSGSLSLNNSGDDVVVKNGSGTVMSSYTYGSEGGDNQSITRDPDLTGSFVKHSTANGANSALFSVGTKISGSAFVGIVTVTESDGSTQVTEGGSTDSYTIVLDAPPSSDATISVSPDAQTSVSPAFLTFTSSNYSTAQTVTVTAVDDGTVEGNHSSTISHTASSDDTNYNGLSMSAITATVVDNDAAGVTVTESGSGTAVTEGGSTDSYTVVLNSAPSSDVTVAVSVSGGEITASSSSLTFTSANYNTAQTVTVTAVDDSDYEGSHSATITHSASSSDSNYDGITVGSVTVTVTDNDLPEIIINEIHYNPNDDGNYPDTDYEFLELYNNENSSADISDYTFTAGITHTFASGSTIAAGGYLILAKNSASYSGSTQWMTGTLTNTGEKIELSSAAPEGTVIDSLTYGSSSPWATAANGDGSSLELINANLDNSFSASWKASSSSNGTPGAQNSVYESDTKPLIYNISRSPTVPAATEDAAVTVTVTDDGSLTAVMLGYSQNGGTQQEIAMTASGSSYAATLPTSGFADGDHISYTVTATDNSSQSSVSDTFGFFVGTTTVASLRQGDSNGEPLYKDYYARVEGVATVASGVFSTYLNVYLQDAGGAINVVDYSSTSTAVTQGNSYTAVGNVTHSNGNLWLVPDNASADITDNGVGTPPSPQVKSISGLLADAEASEGLLVTIENVSKGEGSDDWPASGNNGSLTITDDGGTSKLTLFIDSDTDADELTGPAYPVDLTGIFYQYDTSSPYDGRYQISPRASNDISRTQPTTAVTFATTTLSVQENDGSFEVTTSISNPSSVSATSVKIILKSGEASLISSDTSKTITFAAGSSESQSVQYTVVDDVVYTSSRTLQFVLRSVSGEYGASIAADSIVTVSFLDDEPPPGTVLQFAALAADVDEGAGSTTIAVSITEPSATEATTVEAILSGGTGSAADVGDYSTQSLTFSAGSSESQSLSLTVTDDENFEGDETVIFTLRNAAGGNSASVGNDSTFTLTIRENDQQTVVYFATTETTVVEGIDSTAVLTLGILNPGTAATTVDIKLKSGDASDMNNYIVQAVTFPAGSLDSLNIAIPITDDSEVEPGEIVVLALRNPSGGNAAAVGQDSCLTVTILDNDIYNIVINEIHYNPSSAQGSDDDFEFLELYNAGIKTAYPEMYFFHAGVQYVFTSSDSILPGGYMVLAYNGASYAGSREWTSDGLKNDGENIVIMNEGGIVIDSVSYGRSSPWPAAANGTGPSLELRNPFLDNSLPSNWLSSSIDSGTPGACNSQTSFPPTPFSMKSPSHLALLEITDETINDSLLFDWTVSVDPDSDAVTYDLALEGENFLLSFPAVTDTFQQVAHLDIYSAMDQSRLAHWRDTSEISLEWTVIASDREDSTLAENGPFELLVRENVLAAYEALPLPESFALYQNYPNPFNPNTTISYDLPEQAQVTLDIFDIMGKQTKTLVNQPQDAGFRTAVWDGTDELERTVSAGVYLYRIRAGEFSQTRKMLLLK